MGDTITIQNEGVTFTIAPMPGQSKQVDISENGVVKWHMAIGRGVIHLYTVGLSVWQRPKVHTVAGLPGGISIIIDE
jgi:hypothetical protein